MNTTSGSCGFEATYGLLLLPAKRLKGTVPYHGFFNLSNRYIFPMPFLFLKNFSRCAFSIDVLFLKTYPYNYICGDIYYYSLPSLFIFLETRDFLLLLCSISYSIYLCFVLLYYIILYYPFLFFRNVRG